ncbi:phosphatidylinositol N-acetylglucosaminyltransferase subunit C-like [Halichondria panicea]|uniref:phosphatidylinositol N-acetylglucosaminyltransferase subunit C-like n=1 Tax=Halichondria panicea TaxID=6063 RepID=UPI00312BB069
MAWKKVLYEKQAYADNYVEPEQFLDGLRKNLYTKTYTLGELILSSIVVSVQLSCVCLFVGVYWYIQEGWLYPLTLFTSSTALTALGYILTTPLTTITGASGVVRDQFVPSLLFVLFLAGVSPILRTLTESISTDTIWAMTVGMMATHLVFHNYGSEDGRASRAISLNAAIFGSVCLASRLPSALGAFVVVMFAVQLFALVPQLRARGRVMTPYCTIFLLGLLMGISLPVIISISIPAAVLYLLSVSTVNILCPLWLHRLQHLKNTIHGPWDEAVLQT